MNFSTGAYLVDVNYRGGYRSLGGIFDIGPGNSTDPADYTLVVTNNVPRGGADRSALFTVTSFFQNPTLISGNPGNNVVVFQLTTTIPNTDPLIIQEWYPGYTLTVTDTTGGGAVNVVSTNFDILARDVFHFYVDDSGSYVRKFVDETGANYTGAVTSAALALNGETRFSLAPDNLTTTLVDGATAVQQYNLETLTFSLTATNGGSDAVPGANYSGGTVHSPIYRSWALTPQLPTYRYTNDGAVSFDVLIPANAEGYASSQHALNLSGIPPEFTVGSITGGDTGGGQVFTTGALPGTLTVTLTPTAPGSTPETIYGITYYIEGNPDTFLQNSNTEGTKDYHFLYLPDPQPLGVHYRDEPSGTAVLFTAGAAYFNTPIDTDGTLAIQGASQGATVTYNPTAETVRAGTFTYTLTKDPGSAVADLDTTPNLFDVNVTYDFRDRFTFPDPPTLIHANGEETGTLTVDVPFYYDPGSASTAIFNVNHSYTTTDGYTVTTTVVDTDGGATDNQFAIRYSYTQDVPGSPPISDWYPNTAPITINDGTVGVSNTDSPDVGVLVTNKTEFYTDAEVPERVMIDTLDPTLTFTKTSTGDNLTYTDASRTIGFDTVPPAINAGKTTNFTFTDTNTGYSYNITQDTPVSRYWPETAQIDTSIQASGTPSFTFPLVIGGGDESTQATVVLTGVDPILGTPVITGSIEPSGPFTQSQDITISFPSAPPGTNAAYQFQYEVQGNADPSLNGDTVNNNEYNTFLHLPVTPDIGTIPTDQAPFTYPVYSDPNEFFTLTNPGPIPGLTQTDPREINVNPPSGVPGSYIYTYDLVPSTNPLMNVAPFGPNSPTNSVNINFSYVLTGNTVNLNISITACSSPSGNNKSQFNHVRSVSTDDPIVLSNFIVQMISFIIRTNILPMYSAPVVDNVNFINLFYDPTETIDILTAKQNVYDFFLKVGTIDEIDPLSTDGLFIKNRVDEYFLKVREILTAMYNGGTVGALNLCPGNNGAGTSLCVKDCLSALNFTFTKTA